MNKKNAFGYTILYTFLLTLLYFGLVYFTTSPVLLFFIFAVFLPAAIVLFVYVINFFLHKYSPRYARRSSRILAAKNRIQRQQQALLMLATSKALFSGDLQRATREITQTAAETLNVENTSIWLFNRDFNQLKCACSYDARKRKHTQNQEVAIDDFPRLFQILKSNRIVTINDIKEDCLREELRFLIHKNIDSLLNATIYVEGKLVGVISSAQIGRKRNWTSDEQNFMGSTADIFSMALLGHERRKIEDELILKSSAIESSMDGIAILDNKQCFASVNKAYAQMHGYEDPRLLHGKSWKTVYPLEELARFELRLIPRFWKEGYLSVESIGKRKDESLFPQEISLTKLEKGGLICVVRDTTIRKEVEQNLIESTAFLHKLIDTNPNLIYVKDPKGRFTLVNQAVADIFGCPIEEIIGKTNADFIKSSEEIEKFREDDLEVLNTLTDKFIPEEYITDNKGERHWLQTVKRPLKVFGNDEIHVLGVSTDVTKNKHLQDQLVESQKMEAIGQLAGGIAHDFNNILTGILGYANLLQISRQSDEEVCSAADLIQEAAEKASQLTHGLLGFARKGKHQNIPIDIHSIIKDTLSLLKRTIEKNITIQQSLVAPKSFILGDPVQIQQIILNLAINARDAMSSDIGGTDGGTLQISTGVVNIDESNHFNFQDLKYGKYLKISVADTGCGIAEDIQEKIFDPFFTTKEDGKGTGMGLAMVYGIVKNHGGTVIMRSMAGAGATFHTYLPLAPGKAKMVIEKIPEKPLEGHGRILLVDDHSVIRNATSSMLSSLGYKVVTATNGVEAIEYFKKNGDDIDLVIIDMVMPKMGGKECFRQIKSINPEVKAILSTGYVNNDAVQHILNEGMTGFVQKPYQLNQLSEIVASAMQN